MSITEEINSIKKQRDAVILAHIYQSPEIQDIADLVGDSLELCKWAAGVPNKVIVLCGVSFMAESAKIINPEKTVLLPAPNAGCPMADMVTAEDVMRLRAQNPDAAVVCYVNSSAAVKAASDICCTSSNAVKIVKSLPNKRIIFVPDENLGSFTAAQCPEKEIILFSGYCTTHKRVTPEDVDAARAAVPDAPVYVHPECTPAVVAKADYVGSTAQIVQKVKESSAEKFIIGTEQGIIHKLQKENPDKKFYVLSPKLICPNMKKTNLDNLLQSLKTMQLEVVLDKDIAAGASASLNRMLAVK